MRLAPRLTLAVAALALCGFRPLVFEGNVVLTEDVYRSVLELAEAATGPDLTTPEAEADFIAKQLQGFLHGSGYVLASVQVEVRGDYLQVEIDEGRLERVVLVDSGTLDLIRFKLRLEVPGNVFNRNLIERQLDRLIEELGGTAYSYEVVPTKPVEHPGYQLAPPDVLRGVSLLAPGEPHELRVRMAEVEFREGLDFGFGYRPPDGLYLKLEYKDADLFLDGDRLTSRSEVAIRVFDAVENIGNRFGLSRLESGAQWLSPSLGVRALRVLAILKASLLARTREDINLDGYFYTPLVAGLGLELNLLRGLDVDLFGGVEPRYSFGQSAFDETMPTPPEVPDQIRGFGELRLTWDFVPDRVRADRPHGIDVYTRVYTRGSEDDANLVRMIGDYELTHELGYDELRVGAHGALLLGPVPYFDEVSLGDDLLRGVFTDRFTRRAAALQLEYRISIYRERVKIGLYDHFAVYQALDGVERRDDGFMAANELGFGLHVLAYDAFQVSAYAGLGVDFAADVGFGVALSVKRAF